MIRTFEVMLADEPWSPDGDGGRPVSATVDVGLTRMTVAVHQGWDYHETSISLPAPRFAFYQVVAGFSLDPVARERLLRALLAAAGWRAIPISVGRGLRGGEEHQMRRLARPVRALIAGAGERLPPALRDRYAVDFETDALCIDGRLARLRYAVMLHFWTVPRLRRHEAVAEQDVPRRA